MPTSGLPLDIKALLTDHIESVGQLEVLFIFLNQPSKVFSGLEISRELRSNEVSATKHILHLVEHGFLQSADGVIGFQYWPKDPEMAERITRLQLAFQERPVAVITTLYEKPTDKLKGFADAFKLKKD